MNKLMNKNKIKVISGLVIKKIFIYVAEIQITMTYMVNKTYDRIWFI